MTTPLRVTTSVHNQLKKEIEKKEKREREIFDIRNRINMVIDGLDNNMERLGQIIDPATRSTMFLHTLLTSFDFLIPLAEWGLSGGKKDVMTQDIKKKSQETMNKVKHELNNIMLLCQSAMYAPDHPIGKKVISRIKSEYEKNEKSFGSK